MQTVMKTKSEVIFDELKDEILSGKFEPGFHLVIKQIANRFGVSDIPVREAIKELTYDGLVETIPHVGSRVTVISLKKLDDMLVMRECLEQVAVKLAAQNIDEDTIEKLKEYNDEMIDAIKQGDKDRYSSINRKFHILIIKASNNELIAKTIIQLMDYSKWMRNIFQLFPEILDLSMKEHSEMIKYLSERNSELLAEVNFKHKKRSFDKIRSYIKERS